MAFRLLCEAFDLELGNYQARMGGLGTGWQCVDSTCRPMDVNTTYSTRAGVPQTSLTTTDEGQTSISYFNE